MIHDMTYDDVLSEISKGKSKCNLLIGNGFSIAFDDCFKIKEDGNAEAADGIIRSFIKVNDQGTLSTISYDYPKVMFWQVARRHPVSTRMIRDSEAKRCIRFLDIYLRRGKIFTLNYDMLLFWSIVVGSESAGIKPDYVPPYYDGFNDADGDRLYWKKLSQKQNVFYCHGAMNFREDNKGLSKSKYDMYSVTPVINSFLENENHPIPPIISGSSSEEKQEQISCKDVYFKDCMGALSQIEGSLVILGLSFTQNDDHIVKAIKKAQSASRKLKVYYGYFTVNDRLVAQHVLEENNGIVVSGYFESSTADIWRTTSSNSVRDKNKYAPLKSFLEIMVRNGETQITFSFADIEELIGSSLPDSARIHKAWWASDVTHTQSKAWLAAGYKAKFDEKNEKVIFTKQ